ncbi:MAG: flagellar operon protein YvyF [Syntrophomonadaceae bacterium]|jgi:flagellar operon protein (TIGR03826 family)|nr:flagellar operon protein YvyF [Syntrophomonadaceae bacterium]MDH7498585.1 flagellar operon protein YvyF [Syntrophomonadaceae bacterium]
MAELRNCPLCERVFAFAGGRNLCPACIEAEEAEFAVVRAYVRAHPGATIIEVASATGVEEERILEFLKDGRLISKGLASVVLHRCERCGQPIPAGRYCGECTNLLASSLRQAADTLRAQAGGAGALGRGMHIRESQPGARK